jgi:hypothetical protein
MSTADKGPLCPAPTCKSPASCPGGCEARAHDQATGQAENVAPDDVDYSKVEKLTQAEITAMWRALFRRKEMREEKTPVARALGDALLVLVGVGSTTYIGDYERGRAAEAARRITEVLS